MAMSNRVTATTSSQCAVPANQRNVSSTAHHAPVSSIDMIGASMSFGRNAEIFGENEPADYLYKVVSGAVRTYKILNDGRRQIGAFHLPGDVLGLEVGQEHTFSAEAIVETKLLVIKRTALMSLVARDSQTANELWRLTSRELGRVQDHALLLIKSAEERVASFLIEMARRSPSGDEVQLPMSRQDIADYLGLTIETVSRTITHLEGKATIALPTSRRIVLRNRGALNRLNS
jgi:CRP/FNR family transcriptional regulator, nitrogen fixation regulation protein